MTRVFTTLVTGVILGALADIMRIPLPWMIGPLVGTAAASLFGWDMKAPPITRKFGQLGAAVVIGTTFTPDAVSGLSGYAGIIVFCAIASIGAGVIAAGAMTRITDVSFETSFFASMPGGVAEMSVLAERYGGDTGLVALAQSLRIIIVVVTVPVALVLFGEVIDSPGAEPPEAILIWLPGVAALFLLGGLLGIALDSLNIMNAYFLGGLLAGAVSVLGPVEVSDIPPIFLNGAQVLIGVALGGRIDPAMLHRLRRFFPVAVGGTLALIGFNIMLALLVHIVTQLDARLLVLATAPGGVAEMSITARVLGTLAPLVTAFHLARIILIVVISAPVYRACRRLMV